LHLTLQELLKEAGKDWKDVSGIEYYKGPGSFTGLRIGASLANALASANGVPVSSQNGDNWIQKGINDLEAGDGSLAIPEYGSEPHITAPRK
jgi:tRNA threonylcarbamoyladenosine biosynthesis protein TsaB